MERDKYAKVQIRPNKAECISIKTTAIDPSYSMVASSEAFATETGWLELFRLESTDATLPRFSARWDVKENAVDVDILGAPEASRAFKAERDGYQGHHSRRVGESPASFDIEITTPSMAVFSGQLEMKAEAIVHLKDDAGELISRMRDQLRIYRKP